MKKYLSISAFMFLALLIALQPAKAAELSLPKDTPVKVYFSPKGGCTEAIVNQIGKAKSEILIQAYSFTSKEIAAAIVKAHKRGVHVEIVMDKSNRTAKYSAGDFTAHAGIATYIDAEHAIAHNKIMIIDKETVITGSFNFTKAAEDKNAENVLIMKDKSLAKIYIENWVGTKGIRRDTERESSSA